MTWSWTLIDASGAELSKSPVFESRSEAEAWMAERWASVAERGAVSVSLVSDDEVVYDMGLQP